MPLRIRKEVQEMLRQGQVNGEMARQSGARLVLPVVLYCAVIFGLSSMSTVPEAISHGWDKVAHVVLYAGLGVFVGRYVTLGLGLGVGRVVALAGLFCLAYGISDEFHQLYVEGRSAELGDVIADFVGGLGGSAGYVVMGGRAETDSNDAHGSGNISERRRA